MTTRTRGNAAKKRVQQAKKPAARPQATAKQGLLKKPGGEHAQAKKADGDKKAAKSTGKPAAKKAPLEKPQAAARDRLAPFGHDDGWNAPLKHSGHDDANASLGAKLSAAIRQKPAASDHIDQHAG